MWFPRGLRNKLTTDHSRAGPQEWQHRPRRVPPLLRCSEAVYRGARPAPPAQPSLPPAQKSESDGGAHANRPLCVLVFRVDRVSRLVTVDAAEANGTQFQPELWRELQRRQRPVCRVRHRCQTLRLQQPAAVVSHSPPSMPARLQPSAVLGEGCTAEGLTCRYCRRVVDRSPRNEQSSMLA